MLRLYSTTKDATGDELTRASITYNNSSDKMTLRSRDQDVVTLDDGNVGINKAAPVAVLDITGSYTDNAVRIQNTDAGYYSSVAFIESSGTLKGAIGVGNSSAPSPYADNAYLYTVSGSDFVIVTGASEKARITSDGNVGIGTTSPSQKLHVEGKALITDDVQLTGSNPRLDFNSNGASSLRFYDTTNAAERMRITSSGYTEIKAVSGASRLYLEGNSGTHFLTGTSGGDLGIYNDTASTYRMFIKSDGNIGIGTTSPSQKLEVNVASGDGILIKSADVATLKMKGSGGVYDWGLATTNLAAHDFGIYKSNANGGDPISSGTAQLYFKSTGSTTTNVGIGTTSPSAKLHIESGIVSEPLALFKTSSGDASIRVEGAGGESYLEIANTATSGSATDSWGIGMNDNTNLSFGWGANSTLNKTDALVIDTSGNIQLPAYTAGYLKSDASGNITVDSDTIEDTLDSVTTRGNTTTNAITVGGLTSNGNIIVNNSIIRVSGNSSGTGIIDVDPTYGAYRFYDGTTFRGGLGTGNWASVGASSDIVQYLNSVNYYISNGTTALVKVESGGNVGIGTTSPAEKLDVNGNIQVGDRLLATPSNWGYASSYKTLILGSSGTDYTTDAVTISFGVDVSSNTNSSFTGNGSELLFRNAAHFTTPNSDDTAYLSLMSFNDGNVGIGTTSPSHKLHIESGVLKVQGTSSVDGTAIFVAATAKGTQQSHIHYGSDGDWYIRSASTSGKIVIQDNGGNVGIGTSSPSEKLHVSGNVRIEGDLTVNGSYTQVDTDVNTTEQWNVTNDGTGPAVTINQTGSQDIMDVQDDGTSVFYIEDGGNIGIGTTDPDTKLEISGASGQKIRIKSTKTSLAADELVGAFEAYKTDGSTNGPGVFGSLNIYSQDLGGASYVTLNTSASDGNNVERLRIKSNGSILLSSYGNNNFTGTAAYALAVDSSGNVIETAVQGSPTGGSGTAGKITKWDTSSTLTDSVITESSGNIGIGTASPDSKFHVVADNSTIATFESVGSLANSKTFIVQSGGDRVIFDVQEASGGAAADLAFELGNSEVMRLADTGNVGIGTTSPSSKLEVSGSSLTELKVTESGSSVTTMVQSSTSYGWVGTKTNHTMYIGANDGAKITVLANGNVGIGTTSPSEKLHVTGNILSDGEVDAQNWISVNKDGGSTTSEEAGFRWQYNGTTQYWFYTDNGNNGDLRLQAAGLSGESDTTPRLIIPRTNKDLYLGVSGGNVGIGTTSPRSGYKLTLDKSTNVSGEFVGISLEEAGGTGYGYIRSEDQLTPDTSFVIGHTSRVMTFETNSTERVRIDNSGNVGIGTTSPSTKLYVDGGESTFNRGNSDGAIARFRGKNAEKAVIGTVDSWFSSNVGIGTTNPGSKLEIRGHRTFP